MSAKRLRIAWFSDLTSENSLSAYCSRLLVPRLTQRHSVELFSNSFETSLLGAPHHHYLKAYERHRTEPFDLFFYQLEDGARSRFVRSSIGIMPGVTWFHDLFFSDLGPEATHTSPWELSIKQFYDPSLPFADRSVAPHQLWPKAFREISLSPVSLLSSPWALTEAKTMISDRIENAPGAHRIELLKIPVETFPPMLLPSTDTLRVAALSGAAREGRAHKFLPALKMLKSPWALTWLVEPSEQAAAEVLIREFSVDSNVRLVVGRSVARWREALADSHIALHLRSSSFGHLGPYLQLSMAAGRLTIVSDMAQGEDLPDDVICKVTPGISEGTQLLSIFEAFRSLDIERATETARAYVRLEHSPQRIAETLEGNLEVAASQLAQPMKRWEEIYAKARTALLDEVSALTGEATAAELYPFSRIVTPVISELFSL